MSEISKIALILLFVFVGSLFARGNEKKPENCDGYQQNVPHKDYEDKLKTVTALCGKTFQPAHVKDLKFNIIKGKILFCCVVEKYDEQKTTDCHAEWNPNGHSCSCKTAS